MLAMMSSCVARLLGSSSPGDTAPVTGSVPFVSTTTATVATYVFGRIRLMASASSTVQPATTRNRRLRAERTCRSSVMCIAGKSPAVGFCRIERASEERLLHGHHVVGLQEVGGRDSRLYVLACLCVLARNDDTALRGPRGQPAGGGDSLHQRHPALQPVDT